MYRFITDGDGSNEKILRRNANGEKIGLGLSLLTIVLGDIRGFGFTYTGSIEVASSEERGETGEADLNMIVKGSKKFKEFEVSLVKEKGSDWKVESIQ